MKTAKKLCSNPDLALKLPERKQRMKLGSAHGSQKSKAEQFQTYYERKRFHHGSAATNYRQ